MGAALVTLPSSCFSFTFEGEGEKNTLDQLRLSLLSPLSFSIDIFSIRKKDGEHIALNGANHFLPPFAMLTTNRLTNGSKLLWTTYYGQSRLLLRGYPCQFWNLGTGQLLNPNCCNVLQLTGWGHRI